jgi:hypothetical protein
MNPVLVALLFVLGLFAGMLVLLETGRRIGIRRRAKDPEGAGAGVGAVDAAVFGLLGLLIAFTFSGAAARFDTRRQLIVQETNAIGTAYLRIDLLPATAQPKLRADFRRYVEARLAAYQKLPDLPGAKAELARATALQGEIWTQAVAACQTAGSPAVTSLVLSSLNEMIDITTTRTVALQTHPPSIIFAMLALLTLACSLLAGYGMAGSKTRSWIHMLGFAAILAVAVFVILDLEYPRVGLIRIDAMDQLLADLKDSIK